ncbi:hypothetical protein BKA66DRAFT_441376 [Pyrenochaeta sp. MPI-SDFR-AT-0127]|nr:hypothetical protein BKA66DRAFT_441376 [Pyrenochaeta sp. MPI-SDFR-AT-0127]
MKSAVIILNFIGLIAAAAVNTSQPLLSQGGLGWEGVIVPGEPAVIVWGTSFEDIEAKIQLTNPDFSIWADKEHEDPGFSEDPRVNARAVLEARLDWGKRQCEASTSAENWGPVNEGADILRRVNGNKCWTRARTCQRMTCVRDEAIGMCNSNNHDVTLACTDVANFAVHLLRNCPYITVWCPIFGDCQQTTHGSHGRLWSTGGTWLVRE